MSLHINKSIRVGPFRFNLNKNGLGVAFGKKGLGLGVNGINAQSIKEEFDKLRGLKNKAVAKDEPPSVQWPLITRTNSGEKPTPGRIENTIAMLNFEEVAVRYNLMKHTQEVFLSNSGVSSEEMKNDAAVSFVREMARKHNYQLAEKICNEHLAIIGTQNAYHPVRDWINSVPWDGEDRFQLLYQTVVSRDGFDLELRNALVYHWILSAAAAVFKDDFAAEGCLVFQGNEGIGKTRWAMSLVPDRAWILPGEILEPSKKDGLERALSRWIIELGEIDSTFRKSDRAALKAFVTRSSDVWRTAYDRREKTKPRRTVCIGSVNHVGFLDDSDEHRRYWVIPVLKMNPDHGIDTQQLFAQAIALVNQGEPWWLPAPIKEKLIASNQQFKSKESSNV